LQNCKYAVEQYLQYCKFFVGLTQVRLIPFKKTVQTGITVTEDALSCHCHGSRFDWQGKVLKGPADRSLVRLNVEG
jgi:nitrite reductase/ring-hydroxylating ferredoxin subunit